MKEPGALRLGKAPEPVEFVQRRCSHASSMPPRAGSALVEARFHSPLYLDIVEDGILLFDRERFFASVLDEMRQRMRALGSRRVMLDDGSWYWDLRPGLRFGEVVEI